MISITLILQFSENAVLSQKLINQTREAVISAEELDLQIKDRDIFVDVMYSHCDLLFLDGSFSAEIIIDKRPERTKEVLDRLALRVHYAISSVLNKYYRGFKGRVRTRTFCKEEEGYISSE